MILRRLCIMTALMVLSLGALLVANPNILGEFSSTLNGVSVQVTLSPQGDEHVINTMRIRDLRKDWDQHVGRFVRFTGVANHWFSSLTTAPSGLILLEGYPSVEVVPLDVPNLPETYEQGHKYEFTGFLMRYDGHAKFKENGYFSLRLYAFEIRHLGEAD